MNMLARVEKLETKLLPKKKDPGYKIVLMKNGETSKEAIVRAGLTDWPVSRIMLISFVAANHKPSIV